MTWSAIELGDTQPIEHWKNERDQAIVRRGTTIVTAARSSIFTSTDDGHSFGLNWTVHSDPVDLVVVLDEEAYFGKVSGDDPSLFLVTDVQGPHVFRYSRNGAEIRIDEVAALDADLIAELGLHSPDRSVLSGISAHHWEGRFVLRREGPRWALFVSDDGLDWGSITLGGVFDRGKPFFSNGLVFVRGGDVLAVTEVAID